MSEKFIILLAKAEEIQKELESWANENLNLKINEGVEIRIRIIRRDIVIIGSVSAQTVNAIEKTNELTDEGWDTMLKAMGETRSIPVASFIPVVQFMRARNNQPTTRSVIEDHLKEIGDETEWSLPGIVSGANDYFKRIGLPIRARFLDRGLHGNKALKNRLQFFRIS